MSDAAKFQRIVTCRIAAKRLFAEISPRPTSESPESPESSLICPQPATATVAPRPAHLTKNPDRLSSSFSQSSHTPAARLIEDTPDIDLLITSAQLRPLLQYGGLGVDLQQYHPTQQAQRISGTRFSVRHKSRPRRGDSRHSMFHVPPHRRDATSRACSSRTGQTWPRHGDR